MNDAIYNDVFKNKKVLITGHTGFKGSWLSLWLTILGAKVYGISKDIPTSPSLFETINLEKKLTGNYFIDITKIEDLKKKIIEINPDFVFHMAAQPIVSESYLDPLKTFQTNTLGTANVLESLRNINKECAVVMITSDKCYQNVEWAWGYREHDTLGGDDPYSASKGAAEIIIHSYYHSFFRKNSPVKIASVRAGNVIGGGDWAENRIIPDCFKAWSQQQNVVIRSPKATRPWQHVLEPLSGYLQTAFCLQHSSISGQSYNFGPNSAHNHTVIELLNSLTKYWKANNDKFYTIEENKQTFHECMLLKLNCDKALHYLKWTPTLDYKQTVEFTGHWYNAFYNSDQDMAELTSKQVYNYINIAQKKSQSWTITNKLSNQYSHAIN